LIGTYQFRNIKNVFAACEILIQKGIILDSACIFKGIANIMQNTALFGRWQIMEHLPLTICDIGHNKDGLKNNMWQLKQIPHSHSHLVIGVANDKDLEGMLSILPKEARYYYCKANIPRALDAEELANAANKYNRPGKAFKNVREAIFAAKNEATEEDVIYIGGSAFVVADALEAFNEKNV